MAILPRGTRTAQVSPARAAYAAALALVLPVEAQMTALAPAPAAMLIATVMPRSLNDPVGFPPSTFRYTSHPVRAESTGAGSSGVPPSRRLITGVSPVTGSQLRYSSITPCQMALARGGDPPEPPGPPDGGDGPVPRALLAMVTP